jgi:hypothetical protein
MFVNGVLGLMMIITFCFCIPNLEPVLDTPSGQPVLQVIYNITGGSLPAACVLGTLLCVLQFFATITNIATASRQCWAFARGDRDFPLMMCLVYWLINVFKIVVFHTAIGSCMSIKSENCQSMQFT